MSADNHLSHLAGAELASLKKSSLVFKSLDGVQAPDLNLSEADLAWWRSARFGMFIHWGLYSILGRGEWVMHNEQIPAEEYAKLADDFIPQHFDASAWALLAKQAGMQYMVMVARHHDGFALWNSPGSYGAFNSASRAAQRDFVKEYVEACRAANLRVGLYYSPMDWRFPGYFHPREMPENAALMKQQAYAQVEELVSRYGPIDVLWYDGSWLAHQGTDAGAAWFWEPVRLNRMVRRYQPNVVINPRSGWQGDFQCDEGPHQVRGPIIRIPWEKCFTLIPSWGWQPMPAMPFDEIMRLMLNCFVRDGNVLLNVAPDRDGVIPADQVERLEEIGRWFTQFGESVHDTRGGPFEPVDDVYGSTYHSSQIYLHIFDGPAFSRLTLPPLPQQVLACTDLRGGTVSYEQTGQGIRIQAPASGWSPLDTVLRLDLNAEVD